MTKEVAEKIVRGITDKIECNTVDIDDWAEFWGFTREEYDEFLDMGIKALEQQPKTGHWITDVYMFGRGRHTCSNCGKGQEYTTAFCSWCGAKMEVIP